LTNAKKILQLFSTKPAQNYSTIG